jgi:hypothetical protein
MSETNDFTVTKRNIDVHPGGNFGPLLTVMGYDYSDDPQGYVPREVLGKYAFRRIREGMADTIRGKIPETDGKPVMYVGSNFGKYYWQSHSDTIPVDVLEWLSNNGYSLIENVDGGWVRWEGRPEFSDHYVDFSEANVVDLQQRIIERQ